MSKESKKLWISIVILICIFIGYFGINIYSHMNEKPVEKEKDYYFELKNEERLKEYFDDNEMICVKNRIQKFLADYTFTDEEINNITIEKRIYKHNKSIRFFMLLDDELESLYRVTYNPKTQTAKFSWNGDKDNVDDSCDKNEKPYLYIIDKKAYDNYIYDKKISDAPADENVDPIDDEGE